MRGYAPILLLVLIAVAMPVLVWTLSRLLRPNFYSESKYSTYECGITPATEAREKFSVRYYMVAVLFLVFDVETIFLYPFALQLKELWLFGVVEILIFLFLLLMGYGYIWSKGALTWE
jgi:NADH-quinone oxidoreductase subunit A